MGSYYIYKYGQRLARPSLLSLSTTCYRHSPERYDLLRLIHVAPLTSLAQHNIEQFHRRQAAMYGNIGIFDRDLDPAQCIHVATGCLSLS